MSRSSSLATLRIASSSALAAFGRASARACSRSRREPSAMVRASSALADDGSSASDGAPAIVAVGEEVARAAVGEAAVLEASERGFGACAVVLLHALFERVVELGGARARLADARRGGGVVLGGHHLARGDGAREAC